MTKVNMTTNTPPLASVTNAVSGAGMDRKVATNVSPLKKWLSLIFARPTNYFFGLYDRE